jgi:HAD superfamily hydrolase (TIGR01509 family)
MLKAVLFDLDDTLMPDESAANEALVATAAIAKQWHNIPPGDLKDSVRRVARRLFRANPIVAAHGSIFDISSWEALCSNFEGDDNEMRQLREWAPTYRNEVWNQALCEIGVCDPLLADQLSIIYPHERRNRYVPFPDVKPCLDRLATDHKLGVVTNGPYDLQCAKLEASELRGYFGAILISRQVGILKPDPRIFALALNQLSAAPRDSAFVGDTPKTDVVGAHAASMKAVWLNRDNAPQPEAIVSDRTIHSLTELEQALACI